MSAGTAPGSDRTGVALRSSVSVCPSPSSTRRRLSDSIDTNETVRVGCRLNLDNASMHFILQLFECSGWHGVASKVPEGLGVIKKLTLAIIMVGQVLPRNKISHDLDLGTVVITVSYKKLLQIAALRRRGLSRRKIDSWTIWKTASESSRVIRSMAMLV